MADKKNTSLFGDLTRLFRSGPVVKRRIKNSSNQANNSSAYEMFRKSNSGVYNTAMSAYGSYDRMARTADFSEMEYTPELSSALDIYSEETVASDEAGTVLHIHSENPKVQELLEELFIDTLNIEFNLTAWVRNLVKYGDFFLFNDVSPDHGVVNAFPIPVNEIEREEGYDPEDPMAVRFRWVTQGNQVLENWQISHFRLLGNDAFLPYGSSVLEPARRIWRQLILIEDAMLVYRVVRSPERRVFKIDVGNVPPEDIANYMEQVQTSLKRNQVVDSSTGRVDLRYNPMSVDEDYYLPVRGSDTGTDISTLAGGANTTAIEDVEYIQKKLFAALKIPKAYLGYDEGLGAKATLSQEDVRFSRSIARIQRTVVSELNKLAVIHLYANGFDGEDLIDFKLSLSNPSTIAQQQKLELFRTRFEIAGQVPDGLVDREWIRKNIFKMTDEEIKGIEEGRINDKLSDLDVESVVSSNDAGAGVEMGGPPPQEEPMMETQPLQGDMLNDSDEDVMPSITDEDAPLRAQDKVNRTTAGESIKDDTSGPKKEKKYRVNKHGHKLPVTANNKIDHRPRATNVNRYGPNVRKHRYGKQDQDSIANPYGSKPGRTLKTAVNAMKPPKPMIMEEKEDFSFNNYIDDKLNESAKMTSEIKSILKSFDGIKVSKDNKE